MPSKIRVAMIGAGGMANHVHYPSLASLEDVEIAAICEFDPVRLEATAERHGVSGRYLSQGFDDYQRMIQDVDPDAVYVVGQPNIMYPIWIWCLEQGRNLYIEKPMGLTSHQARALGRAKSLHYPGQLPASHVPDGGPPARTMPEAWSDHPRRLRILQVESRPLSRRARPHDG